MCRSCYEDYGAPTIDTDRVRHARDLIARVYEEELAGGTAHVVVDDWNLADGDLGHCLAASTPGSREYDCLMFLQTLSEAERAAALGLHDGFWTPSARPVPAESVPLPAGAASARARIFAAIIAERAHQDRKFPHQDMTFPEWLAVLGEEFGEVSQEVLRLHFGGVDSTRLAAYRAEVIQVAATAVAMLEALDRAAL